ncbi:MAG: hypothetical protein C0613_13585 [Desulfobulbaceae bacterium]|nr:MAG: hypothetical protein C0613_13585 [Desulfobulbaceae bacterium]
MNKSTLLTLAVFILATTAYALTIPGLSQVRQERRAEQISYFVEVPPQLAKVGSLEFKGIVADYLMLEAMTFMGERIGQNRDLSAEEWQHLHRLLVKITSIDPAFWDPYVLAETMLVWQAGMMDEANELLLNAARHRPWDYRPFYFLGFNSFYFKKDVVGGAKYLRQAARKANCPDYLKSLAARLSLYGNETALGILFLEDLIRETSQEESRAYLAKRLEALRAIHILEKAVAEYGKTLQKKPAGVTDLVKQGFLEEIPPDPYGGDWVIMDNGRIYTTSELVEKKHRRPAQKK